MKGQASEGQVMESPTSFCVVLLFPSPLLGDAVLGDAAVPPISGVVLRLPFFRVVVLSPPRSFFFGERVGRGGTACPPPFGGAAFPLLPEVVPFPFFLKETKSV